LAKKSRKKSSKVTNPDETLYYTLPYDDVQPFLLELKDTVQCLNEMGDSHRWGRSDRSELAGHRRSRRAA
jgi:hypothetical protein